MLLLIITPAAAVSFSLDVQIVMLLLVSVLLSSLLLLLMVVIVKSFFLYLFRSLILTCTLTFYLLFALFNDDVLPFLLILLLKRLLFLSCILVICLIYCIVALLLFARLLRGTGTIKPLAWELPKGLWCRAWMDEDRGCCAGSEWSELKLFVVYIRCDNFFIAGVRLSMYLCPGNVPAAVYNW